jgi:hypothetical protein
MAKKRLNKKGGVNNIPIHLNEMEISTPSQGSLHLSDLNDSPNNTPNSMDSGLTTNESEMSGYINTNGQVYNSDSEGTLTSSQEIIGGSKKKTKSKSKSKTKKVKKTKKINKTKKTKRVKISKKSKKNKYLSRKLNGGAGMDTSPTPTEEKIKDMLSEFN